jgi:hypothetical protein
LDPTVVHTQLPNNDNTPVTNMAEHLAEAGRRHNLSTPFIWEEHNPKHEGEVGEYSQVKVSYWAFDLCLGGA